MQLAERLSGTSSLASDVTSKFLQDVTPKRNRRKEKKKRGKPWSYTRVKVTCVRIGTTSLAKGHNLKHLQELGLGMHTYCMS